MCSIKLGVGAFLVAFCVSIVTANSQVVQGTVVAWGRNDYQQSSPPAGLTNVVFITSGISSSIAIRSDGSAVSWGTAYGDTGPDNFVAAAVAVGPSVWLRSDGTLDGWSIPTNATHASAVAAFSENCMALLQPGTVVEWGAGWNGNNYVTLTPPADLTNAVAIAAGQAHGMALRSDGAVLAWGDNTYGQLDVPAALTNVVAIAAGQYFSVALRTDGSISCWGAISAPPAETNIVAIAAGAFHALGLRGDGSLVAWGTDEYGDTVVPSTLTNAIGIAGGAFNSVALANNGDVVFASRQELHPFVYSGSSILLKSAFANFPVSAYQWQFNGVDIHGATNALLPLASVPSTRSGAYHVIVSNVYGAAASSNVVLTAGDVPPCFVSRSADQLLGPGTNASLFAKALGSLPMTYQWQFNGTNINAATNSSLIITNISAGYRGYITILASNAYGYAATNIYLHVLNLPEALDATNLIWTTGGDAPWFSQGLQTDQDEAAAQSGNITANQQSTLGTTLQGPATLSFSWKVSSEPNGDYLTFSLDGSAQSSISGSVGWQQQIYYLTDGPHNLSWIYAKNAAVNSGSDAAWLDHVTFSVGPTAAFVVSSPKDQKTTLTSNVTFAVTAQGTPPLTYQWFFDGTGIPGATNSALSLTNIQPANLGSYTVVVSNSYGGATSGTAVLWVPNLYAWGAGTNNYGFAPNYGQSIVPATANGAISIAAGAYHSLALLTNGQVIGWGISGATAPSALTNAIAISAGYAHSVALRSNGTVTAWGSSSYGQTSVPATATNIAAICAGGWHTLALKSNGVVVAWGGTSTMDHGQTTVPSNLTNVSALAAGYYHSLALLSNGTVVGWGFNNVNQAQPPAGLSNVIAISAGGSNSLALKKDGTLAAWGNSTSDLTNIPSGLTNVIAIASGMAHQMALTADGRLVGWGLNGNGQTNVPKTLTNIAAMAGGGWHSLALAAFGAPQVAGQIISRTVYAGATVSFDAGLVGHPPVGYQWQFNGDDIPGATNSQLILTNVSLSAAGSYRCIAMNRLGVATNQNATLTVLRTPLQFGASDLLSNNGFYLELNQLSGHGEIVVYASSDLINWVPLLTNAAVLGTLRFTDPTATNTGVRFYRAVER